MNDLRLKRLFLLDKPTIDLDESVEDNILLSIPIQVLTEEEQKQSRNAKWQ